jgi:hypothetical protein
VYPHKRQICFFGAIIRRYYYWSSITLIFSLVLIFVCVAIQAGGADEAGKLRGQLTKQTAELEKMRDEHARAGEAAAAATKAVQTKLDAALATAAAAEAKAAAAEAAAKKQQAEAAQGKAAADAERERIVADGKKKEAEHAKAVAEQTKVNRFEVRVMMI